MTESKLESASLLVLGLEGLRPGDKLPISTRAVKDAGSIELAANRQRLAVALTSAVLYSIVVELVVKHIWEIEHGGQTAKPTHDVNGLFAELDPETQRKVEEVYDDCCRQYKDAVQAGQQQHGPEVVDVDLANLEEALRWNADAVKNLKYDMRPSGRTVPNGMLWGTETMWVPGRPFPSFAIRLAIWARNEFTMPS